MRTPWKLLHDVWMTALGLKLPDPTGKLGGLLFIIVVVAPLAIVLFAARAISNSILPNSSLSTFLNDHFVGALIIVTVLFFFYSFFRAIWDGLREPTVDSSGEGNK